MISSDSNVLQLPEDIQKVPKDHSGVYFFSLSFPSNYELGLIDPLEFDLLKFNKLVERAIAVIKLALNRSDLDGHLQTTNDALHLRVRYLLSAKYNSPVDVSGLVGDCFEYIGNYQDALELVAALRFFLRVAPPIYIGMTSKQSFYDRLSQHLSGETDFSNKIIELGLSWSDLNYGYFNVTTLNAKHTRNIEKIGQYICVPTLSRV